MGCVCAKQSAKEPKRTTTQRQNDNQPVEQAGSGAKAPAPAAKPAPPADPSEQPEARASPAPKPRLAARSPPAYPNIAMLSRDKARVYDCAKQIWKSPVSLQAQLQLQAGSSWLWLPDSRLFLLEGETTAALCLDLTSGAANSLQPMSVSRNFPGVVLYEKQVLVFGGAAAPTAEQYDLNAQAWQNLPNMYSTRSKFNPCLYDTRVYLCGGTSLTAEFYNITLKRYSALGFSIPEATDASALLVGEDVVIISRNFISKWSLDEEKLTVSPRSLLTDCWSSCTPVRVSNWAYLVVADQLLQVDLTTAQHNIVENDEEPRILASD